MSKFDRLESETEKLRSALKCTLIGKQKRVCSSVFQFLFAARGNLLSRQTNCCKGGCKSEIEKIDNYYESFISRRINYIFKFFQIQNL